jgi:hypothetical protein
MFLLVNLLFYPISIPSFLLISFFFPLGGTIEQRAAGTLFNGEGGIGPKGQSQFLSLLFEKTEKKTIRV